MGLNEFEKLKGVIKRLKVGVVTRIALVLYRECRTFFGQPLECKPTIFWKAQLFKVLTELDGQFE
jgi:hypothetical protein